MPVSALVPRFRGNAVIEWADHTYRDPAPGELRIRIAANAICGTDRHEYYDGSPIVPGHEAAGVVAEAGPGSSVPVGTRGVIYLMDYCGECRSCLVGATNQCFAKRADVGQSTDGGYGPYALVHETNFFPIGDDLDLGLATMLLDVMGTSSHALGRAALLRPDIESIFVAGAGPIGLGLLVMAKVRYGTDFPVYLSDVSGWRRKFAENLGAVTFAADDQAGIAGAAPDMSFDSSGKEAARTLALAASSKRGGLICVGHGEGITLNVSADLIAPERAVVGSEYFRFDELPENLDLLRRHQDYIGQVITHRVPATEVDEAFRLFFAGETGKVVVTQEPAA
ncbi:L-idonate 5-dehydrogenase/S-(hydroxymethyl)glutathione dehydrogenase/alcohol dehydrogenase [Kribbella amoyensis]|uniref:L-idonate 5-dehydrogenase/S-(Hydroxymethyl)glutathione dehydrogenase/alcohol dehydrogenase n=1 Tax=Kribbella amoyensis TaxID=996641 RepID=A0A561BSC3_9ACTN|nr:alcohol dehydrogenase catalytic domain-containing protein [Kribbella amoyensis]TWD81766.1 L-idonate 5-dehydrogenase/S-(hydroxymethyl)glutathione dehydrogenase/alcohol dehydrogenase [Kribbella amoyensis]